MKFGYKNYGAGVLRPVIPVEIFYNGVVEQKGFFDIFVIKFDLVKEEIELKGHRR